MSKVIARVLLVFAVCSVVANGANAHGAVVQGGEFIDNYLHPEAEGSSTNLQYLIQGSVNALKGMVLGLQQGLLNDDGIRLSERCFSSDKINHDLMFMADFASRKRQLWDAVKFTTTGRDIIINEMENCRFTSTISLLQEFCHSHDY